MNFTEAVEYLLSLGHETLAMKLGLRNTELLLDSLNNPQRAFFSVQIAGTNGKGSTAVVLDSICRNSGIKTGLYTSPHLVSITERIKINDTEISEEEFARCATVVRNAANELIAEQKIEALPTFFEHVTAIALLAFREAGVEVVILETGLGGRLDSTTAAGAQVVAITQIAMDHEEYLGSTLESIAREKAAIIRPGVEAVVVAGKQEPNALAVIKERCDELQISPSIDECTIEVNETTSEGRMCASFKTRLANYSRLWPGLIGEHQLENIAVAMQLAEKLRTKGVPITRQAIVRGVESAKHPGRLEQIFTTRNFLLDGAHNPAGAGALRKHLERFVTSDLTIVFGAMRDKQLETIGALIFPLAKHLILTQISNVRSAELQTLREIAEQHLPAEDISLASTTAEAIDIALAKTSSAGVICVTGSLYLIGEVKQFLVGLSQHHLR